MRPALLAPVALLLLTQCRGAAPARVPLAGKAGLAPRLAQASGEASLLAVGLDADPGFRAEAERLGVRVEGDAVLKLTGSPAALAKLTVKEDAAFQAVADEPVTALRDQAGDTPDPQIYYLARKDFGLPAWQAEHPTHDGRGVTVGIIDDGVSPLHTGLQTTSTGERKYLAHTESSSDLRLPLAKVDGAVTPASNFVASLGMLISEAWQGDVDETKAGVDLNGDGKVGLIPVAVVRDRVSSALRACVDVNVDQVAQADECFGLFGPTGEYGYWTKDKTQAIVADFDAATATLQLSHPDDDSHGEGVASVLTGHALGGRFDGVAPGAKFLDYNLSAPSSKAEEQLYTLGTFTTALEWLGKNGAEVVNVSYSLYFHSVEGQSFMYGALNALVQKYQFAISWSAGNNGPGLGSFNRGLLYPRDCLVAAAFVSKDLDEYVHGVTGLPDPGRIVYYSSRGPSPDFGTTPTVASPLASLVQYASGGGFGGFSGTSSASPALAGFTTVLLSAVKQEGLAFDLGALVNAVRLSAKPLEGVPSIFQGAGLPKIDAALAVYKDLIAGRQFMRVAAGLRGVAEDGLSPTGVFLRTSQTTGDVYETSATLAGLVAKPVPMPVATALLRPLLVRYTQPWVSGPSRTFLSIGRSTIAFQVDLAALRAQPSGGEHLADVELVDEDTGRVVHRIPVTVVDDRPLDAAVTWTPSVEPEDGARYHFYVRPGTPGVRFVVTPVSGDAASGQYLVYNPASVVVAGSTLTTASQELMLETAEPGWYQVAIAKVKGSAQPLVVQVQVLPVSLALRAETTSVAAPSVKLENGGPAQDVRIFWRTKREVLATKYISTQGAAPATWSVPLTRPGFHSVKLERATRVTSSFPRDQCIERIYDAQGALKFEEPTADSVGVAVTDALLGGRLDLSCVPFESTPTGSAAVTWKAVLSFGNPVDLASTYARIERGMSTVSGTWTKAPEAGQTVEVVVMPAFSSSGSITLGDVTAI